MATERREPNVWEEKLIEIGLERKWLSLMTTDAQREKVYKLLKNHLIIPGSKPPSTALSLPKGAVSSLSMDPLEITEEWQIRILIGTHDLSSIPARARDRRGATPAHYAAWAGNQVLLNEIAASDRHNGCLDSIDSQNRTIFMYAAWSDDPAIFNNLMSWGSRPKHRLTDKNVPLVDKNERPWRLHHIISGCRSAWTHEELVALSDMGVVDSAGRNAYYYALWTKNTPLFKQLLEERFDERIDVTYIMKESRSSRPPYYYYDREGRDTKTLAHYAAWLGNRDALEALRLKGYTRFDEVDDGLSMAHFAALSGNKETLSWVHEHFPALFEAEGNGFFASHAITECAKKSGKRGVLEWIEAYKTVKADAEAMISDAEGLLKNRTWKDTFTEKFLGVDPVILTKATAKIQAAVNQVVNKRADTWIKEVKKQLNNPGWKNAFQAACVGAEPTVVATALKRVEKAFNIASHEMVAEAGETYLRRFKRVKGGMYNTADKWKEAFIAPFGAVDSVIVEREIERIVKACSGPTPVVPETSRRRLVDIGVDNTVLSQSILKEEDFEKIHGLLINHTSDALTLTEYPDMDDEGRLGGALSIPRLKIEAVWQLNALAGTEGNLDPTMRDNRGANIAHYAAWSGNIRALDWIKEHHPELLLQKDKFNHTVYYYSSCAGNEAAHHWLTSNVSLPSDSDFWSEKAVPMTLSGNGDLLNDLLLGQDPNTHASLIYYATWAKQNVILNSLILDYKDFYPRRTLQNSLSLARRRVNLAHYAAWAGNTEALVILKANQWDFSSEDALGHTIAHFAALSGQKDTLSWVYKENSRLILDHIDVISDFAKRSPSSRWILEYKEILQAEKEMIKRMKTLMNSTTWATEFTATYTSKGFDPTVIQDVVTRLKKEYYLVSQKEVVQAANQLIHPNAVERALRERSGNRYDAGWETLFRMQHLGVNAVLLNREIARIKKGYEAATASEARKALTTIGVSDALITDSVLPEEKYEQVSDLLKIHTTNCLVTPPHPEILTRESWLHFIDVPLLQIKDAWQLDALAGECNLDPAQRDNRGANIAHYAAWSGNTEALNAIRDQCPELLMERDQAGRTVLHYAALSKTCATYEWVEAQTPVLMNNDSQSRSVEHYALLSDNQALISKLGLDSSSCSEKKDLKGMGLAIYAIWSHNPVFNAIYEHNESLVDPSPPDIMNAAHFAAWCGNTTALQTLKEKHFSRLEFRTSWNNVQYTIAQFAAWSGKRDTLAWVYREYPLLITENLSEVEQSAEQSGSEEVQKWMKDYKRVARETAKIIERFQTAHPLDVRWIEVFNKTCDGVDMTVRERHLAQITEHRLVARSRMETIFRDAIGNASRYPKVTALLESFINDSLYAGESDVAHLQTAVLQWHRHNLEQIDRKLATAKSAKSLKETDLTPADIECYLSMWTQLDIDQWVEPSEIEPLNTLRESILARLETYKQVETTQDRVERQMNAFIDKVLKQHPFEPGETLPEFLLDEIEPTVARALTVKLASEIDPSRRMADRIERERDKRFFGYTPRVQDLLTDLATEVRGCSSRDRIKTAMLTWHERNLSAIETQFTHAPSAAKPWTVEEYEKYLSLWDTLGVTPYLKSEAHTTLLRSVSDKTTTLTAFFKADSVADQIIKDIINSHPLDSRPQTALRLFKDNKTIPSAVRTMYLSRITTSDHPSQRMAALIKEQSEGLESHPKVKTLFEDLHRTVAACSTREEIQIAVQGWQATSILAIQQHCTGTSAGKDHWTDDDYKCYQSTFEKLGVGPYLTISPEVNEASAWITAYFKAAPPVDRIIDLLRIHPLALEGQTMLEAFEANTECPQEIRTLYTQRIAEINKPIEKMTAFTQKQCDHLEDYPKVKALFDDLREKVSVCTDRAGMQAIVQTWQEQTIATIKSTLAIADPAWTADEYRHYQSAFDALGVAPYIKISSEVVANRRLIEDSLKTRLSDEERKVASAEKELIETLRTLHPLDPAWEKELKSFCDKQNIPRDDREERVSQIIRFVHPGQKMVELIRAASERLLDYPKVKALFQDLVDRVEGCGDRNRLKGAVVSWELKHLVKTAAPMDEEEEQEREEGQTTLTFNAAELSVYQDVRRALKLDVSPGEIEIELTKPQHPSAR